MESTTPKSSGSDRLLLWAVAGLTGVVISSGAQPGGPAGGRAALRAPRAVLWGQHTGSLSWPQPQVIAFSPAHPAPLICGCKHICRLCTCTCKCCFGRCQDLGQSSLILWHVASTIHLQSMEVLTAETYCCHRHVGRRGTRWRRRWCWQRTSRCCACWRRASAGATPPPCMRAGTAWTQWRTMRP